MTKEKVRLYKNPNRVKVDAQKPYVPQYLLYGYEPKEMKSVEVPDSIQAAQPILSKENPRIRKPNIRQEYTTPTLSPIGRGPVPNVGNNMEHTWSGVDGEIIDDLNQEIDPNHPMIDNNDYITNEALGALDQSVVEEEEEEEDNNNNGESISINNRPVIKSFMTEQELQTLVIEDEKNSELSILLQELDPGNHVLLIDGEAVMTGPFDFIQEQATLLVFGEHELCDGNPIPVEDLVIVKKLNLKVGLFAE